MTYILIGLGNPGDDYRNTRHNLGRMALEAFVKKEQFPEWKYDKKIKAYTTKEKIGKNTVLCILPETYMNKSGNTITETMKKKPENVLVLHDDIDIPLGSFKISFGKRSGGHKGVESIKRALKTKDFIRIRIGTSPRKKPAAENVPDFLLKNMRANEKEKTKPVFKDIHAALITLIHEGLAKAMSMHN